MPRLTLSLHLREDGWVIGGGWAYYHPADTLVASAAFPAFVATKDGTEACEALLTDFLEQRGHQLAF